MTSPRHAPKQHVHKDVRVVLTGMEKAAMNADAIANPKMFRKVVTDLLKQNAPGMIGQVIVRDAELHAGRINIGLDTAPLMGRKDLLNRLNAFFCARDMLVLMYHAKLNVAGHQTAKAVLSCDRMSDTQKGKSIPAVN